MILHIFNKDEYNKYLKNIQANPNHIIYGEWLIPHTIQRYRADAWKKLYVFDIFDAEKDCYIPYEIYEESLARYDINHIPAIATLTNPSVEDIKNYLSETGNFLIENGADPWAKTIIGFTPFQLANSFSPEDRDKECAIAIREYIKKRITLNSVNRIIRDVVGDDDGGGDDE